MRKLLIAEDDFMIADMLKEIVTDAGYIVCAVAATAAELIAFGELHEPELAIIDLRLAGGDDGADAAAILAKRVKLNILYATGNCHAVVDKPPAVGDVCLNKPFTPADVTQALKIIEHIAVTGKVPASLPRRLHLLRNIPTADQ